MYREDKEQTEGFVEKFKLQLVGSDPTFWATKLYPEFFQGGEADEGDDGYSVDSEVEYVMPEMTEEQVQEMMNEMLNSNPEAMTFDEYEDW